MPAWSLRSAPWTMPRSSASRSHSAGARLGKAPQQRGVGQQRQQLAPGERAGGQGEQQLDRLAQPVAAPPAAGRPPSGAARGPRRRPPAGGRGTLPLTDSGTMRAMSLKRSVGSACTRRQISAATTSSSRRTPGQGSTRQAAVGAQRRDRAPAGSARSRMSSCRRASRVSRPPRSAWATKRPSKSPAAIWLSRRMFSRPGPPPQPQGEVLADRSAARRGRRPGPASAAGPRARAGSSASRALPLEPPARLGRGLDVLPELAAGVERVDAHLRPPGQGRQRGVEAARDVRDAEDVHRSRAAGPPAGTSPCSSAPISSARSGRPAARRAAGAAPPAPAARTAPATARAARPRSPASVG